MHKHGQIIKKFKNLIKKHPIILSLLILILVGFYIVTIHYHNDYKNIAWVRSLYYGSQMLVNIVEMIGIISIIISVIKYESSKKNTKLIHTMKIIAKIQKEIFPVSSENKLDKEIKYSEKICTYNVIDFAFCNILNSLENSKQKYIYLTEINKEEIAKSIKARITREVYTFKRNSIRYDAKFRVMNEILIRLFRWTIYMNNGLTDNTYICKKLGSNVSDFINNKKYNKYFSDESSDMIKEIKKVWKC